MSCVFESYTWGWRWSPGRRHERLSVRRCHTERQPPPLSWAASQAWGHKGKGGHTPLHPPHRAPGDCGLVRRVWILETQHILAHTDNHSQLLVWHQVCHVVSLYTLDNKMAVCRSLLCCYSIPPPPHLFWIKMLSEWNLANEKCYVLSPAVAPWNSMWVLSSGNTRPAVAHTTCNLGSKCVLP